MPAVETEDEVRGIRRSEAGRAKNQGPKARLHSVHFVLVVCGCAGLFYWLEARQYEGTDDAFVEMHRRQLRKRWRWRTTQLPRRRAR
jgi:hypothetical protein